MNPTATQTKTSAPSNTSSTSSTSSSGVRKRPSLIQRLEQLVAAWTPLIDPDGATDETAAEIIEDLNSLLVEYYLNEATTHDGAHSGNKPSSVP